MHGRKRIRPVKGIEKDGMKDQTEDPTNEDEKELIIWPFYIILHLFQCGSSVTGNDGWVCLFDM